MAHLEVETKDSITTLTMNRPESRNALSDEMVQGLIDALHDAELDSNIRCVVLRGAGDHFLAGGDVKSFSKLFEMSDDEIRKNFVLRVHNLHPVMFAMRRMPKPIIASVRGAAAGAGVSVALACDLIIAADTSFMTLAYCNIGASPDGSSTYQLPRTLGIKKAMEIALLGDRFTAQEAKEMGLVNFVVPADKLEEETLKLATRLANGPTRALANAKALLYRSIESQFEAQLQAEGEAFADSAASPDFKEGVMAFVEKRKPNFTGK
ncbi:MAG: enoyl-CoA hydratase/isomerase family protein [Candidatus Hydrogenedentes bacterium]|nr:enoyl-CoA hydratase/isomerase family protein [Candidatus Hydrogenedentota bacterium]